jgi:type I restriction enzyme S subunit
MSFPRYPAYKDSGVAWLGDYPTHWQAKPLWTLFRRVKRQGHEGQELLSVYRDHGVVPKSSRDDNFNKPSDDLSAYQLVEVDDLAINKMKAWQGSVAISKYKGIVSPAYHVYTRIHQQNSSYLHHLMRSDRYITGYLSLSKGIRVNQWDLQPEYHSRMPILLPPLEEQISIGYFLDHETAKIDALIAEQQRLIELLQEKRQAVISHAVTKGLNPDAPMKDSGVEWLGEVPEHWGVTCLKHATDLIVDCPHETPAYAEDGEFLVVRTADLDGGRLRDESDMKRVDVLEYTNRIRRASLEEHDIVYGREGERWGHAALVPLSLKFCLGQRMMQFRCGPNWEPEFLMWLLNSRAVYLQGALDTVGATSPHVNVATIRNYILPAPPRQEQALIAGYLANAAAKHDSLIDESKVSSSVLQERRSALISAAVTGQIDVRGLAPEPSAA